MLYKLIWRTGGVAQESECFPSKLKALSSSSRAAKKKKKVFKNSLEIAIQRKSYSSVSYHTLVRISICIIKYLRWEL
jgi:hypothetical protein